MGAHRVDFGDFGLNDELKGDECEEDGEDDAHAPADIRGADGEGDGKQQNKKEDGQDDIVEPIQRHTFDAQRHGEPCILGHPLPLAVINERREKGVASYRGSNGERCHRAVAQTVWQEIRWAS